MIPPTMPHRRKTDPKGQWRITAQWVAATAPVRDGPRMTLSLTKLMSTAFALLFIHLTETTHTITWLSLTLAIVSLAAAFGKSTFNFFLDKQAMKATP